MVSTWLFDGSIRPARGGPANDARPRNQAGPHRPTPPCPPIDPAVVYPIRRLSDWGFGGATVAAMQRDGLPVMRFSKWKFVSGKALVEFLERAAEATGEGSR